MNLRLLIGLAAAFLACGAAPAFAADQKPNIILILGDDIGIPGLSCYGGMFKTPHLDKLAADGIRFEHCFAAPLCAPTRAMLMTGRYAFRTGVTNNGQGANATPEKDGCLAQVLKQAGYATAVAGKWRQLSHFTTQAEGLKWGFNEFLIWGAGLPDDEGAGQAEGKKQKKGDRYWNPDYNLNGKPLPDAQGKYGPDALQAFAIDFINRHKSGPFFLYYPTPLIHSPILPTPDSPKTEQTGKAKGAKAKGGKTSDQGLYADNIHYLDKQVGQLVSELDRLGIRENTLILFVGDNGSVGGGLVNGQPVDGGKSKVLEGGSRVPFIASWPGTMPKGVVSKDLIDVSDFLPTFAEVAGAKVPTERKIDGHSFAPQLRGERGRPREWAYVQLNQNRYVRSLHWKLTGDGELFDMKNAPFQQIPVDASTTDAEAISARTTLQAALDHLKTDAPALPQKRAKKSAKK